MSALKEDRWIFLSASACNMLQYVVLVEAYKKKSGFNQTYSWKMKENEPFQPIIL